ncbi:MAG: hypothetical protein QFC55_02130 [Chloroflexota bacterium]|nr:hypothetical protein [Chloroflexota bacterium]
MNVEAVARPLNWRAIPWAALILTVICGLIVVRSLALGQFSPIGTLGFAAPVAFAAVVAYVRPPDRRFTWAALAIAATPVVVLAANWLPDAWFSLTPGDWKNAAQLLLDAGGVARVVAIVLGFVGLGLLGLAFGGVRTFMSAVILAFGVLVAAAGVIWVLAHPIADLPLLDLARSVAFSVLTVIGWAFVFAAALEALRTLSLIGTGLILANTVINVLLLWWTIPASANTDLLSLLVGGPTLLGWIALMAAALRGELSHERSGAAARSRAARGGGAQRRAG